MKKLFGIIGGLLIVGAIGSEQIGAIDFTRAITQCLIGFPMLVIGVM